MFWLIDSCQNSVSADQYRLTVSRAQVSTHWVRVFFWRYPLTSCYFSNDRRLKFNFLKCIWNKSCSSAALLISNWPRTRKFNRLLHPFDFSHHSHALVTLYVQFLCSDWSKFDRWIHAENLCSILKVVYFDSWSWQSFVSTCDVFNCLFPLAVQNEIQLLSRLFCNSWLVCLLRFLLTNAPLVKVIGNPISDGIVFKNELTTHLPLLEAYNEGWKVSSDSRAASRLVSLSNYCLDVFFFFGFLKSSVVYAA